MAIDTKPPIELQRSSPRDVQLTASGKFLTIVGAVLLVGSVFLTTFLARESVRQSRERRLLDTTGVTTAARVVRLWRESDEHKTARVEYVYDVEGREFDARSKLPQKWWTSLRTGDSLDVRYLPSDPRRHFVLHAAPPVMPIWVSVIAGVAMVIAGLGSVFAVQTQRRLLADGRVARATVTKITKHHTSHGGTHRSVRFTFPTLSGSTVAGKVSTGRKGPDVGANVWVIYDPSNPKRSAMYPMQFVTLPRS